MSDDLVTYLDAIDERLLDYLDAEEELAATVRRLQRYATALLEGSEPEDGLETLQDGIPRHVNHPWTSLSAQTCWLCHLPEALPTAKL